jgi:hypothetical protein
MTSATSVQCLCGGIQIELSGDPIAQFYCHCDDCQAVHGAAYVPIAMYPARAVVVRQGTPKMWARKTTPRATCPECGTRLFAEVAPVDARSVSAHLLPGGLFEAAFHMQCAFARAGVADALPHFTGLPPSFGGPDTKVAW